MMVPDGTSFRTNSPFASVTVWDCLFAALQTETPGTPCLVKGSFTIPVILPPAKVLKNDDDVVAAGSEGGPAGALSHCCRIVLFGSSRRPSFTRNSKFLQAASVFPVP